MSKKVSQEEIDKQLGGIGCAKPELDHAPIRKELEGKVEARGKAEGKANLKFEPSTGRSHSGERHFMHTRKQGVEGVKKISFDFKFLLKAFLLILCLKSWWILVMWGVPFFFKDWPFLGIFQIQPYLVPNLLMGWFLVWKGKHNLFKKIGELKSLRENTKWLEILLRVFGFLIFQCPVSLVFATIGANPFLSRHVGSFAALICNLIVGAVCWHFVPRRFPKLNLDKHDHF